MSTAAEINEYHWEECKISGFNIQSRSFGSAVVFEDA